MQGIYRDYPLAAGDVAMTCAMDLAMNEQTGICSLRLTHEIIVRSGCAGIIKL